VLATRLALVENEPATMLAELAEAAPEPRSLRDVLGAEVPQCGADLLRGGFE
jgi:hypothetical protein